MTYPRLNVVPFGRQLFETADLDPVYVALQHASLDKTQLARWLVSYWLFYSSGFACWASEIDGRHFWRALEVAAENEQPTPFGERWPRGSERRHFRGKVAVEAVKRLRGQYDAPLEFLDYLTEGAADVQSVIDRARQHYLFGDWIAFKIADMLDAVWEYPVDQSDVSVFLYKTPRDSILESWRDGTVPIDADTEEAGLADAMDWLRKQLQDCRIPHRKRERPDWFSLETVWCKHASHMHGHYPLMKDTREIRHGLQPWTPLARTARTFLAGMPKEPGCLM
ncbi:MAG TPA: hypothetical protein VHC20_04500 [Candidatus Paceibacterota bacterium]|nr:hypothetical protein [Candidatus Paceibacterota bacterium]